MKIGILIPTQEQKNQAGVRIRYSRIEPALKQLGHRLELIPIQDLSLSNADNNDVYLISKCYDARALLIARQLRLRGRPVGVDLFDDYFSQHMDSRFVRLRYWLQALVAECSFILCSTAQMADIARDYAPDLPVHIMNDPATEINIQTIASEALRKFEFAHAQRRIDVAWFGMGDNPNFPVGLSDLAAFGSEVDRLRGHGYDVRLSILTNRRAMTPDNLAAISRLATPFTLDEWSESQEKSLLERSLISFLPVNAQQFSRVKSLNRAITALTSGVQVLSAGFPLYASLAPFIYRSPLQFLHDLRVGNLALRQETTQKLADTLAPLAEIGRESTGLADFLSDVCNKSSKPGAKSTHITAVIHGKETSGNIHKFTQKMGALSVASPFCQMDLNFDIRFEFTPGGKGFDIHVANKKTSLIEPAIQKYLVSQGNILTTQYKKLQTESAFPEIRINGMALAALNTLGSTSAAYPFIMRAIIEIMQRLAPGAICFHAEQSKMMPWQADIHASLENDGVNI